MRGELLAIDPGNLESGWCLIDTETCRPLQYGKDENHNLLTMLYGFRYKRLQPPPTYIEMIASYGMSVGASIFQTCVWVGRFYEAMSADHRAPVTLAYRTDVKMHHCHTTSAKDGNVTQALVDRFAPDTRNHGKGTKADPGWFYGFAGDVWQAYALAVYAADTLQPHAAERK